jgi:hypothetical protein
MFEAMVRNMIEFRAFLPESVLIGVIEEEPLIPKQEEPTKKEPVQTNQIKPLDLDQSARIRTDTASSAVETTSVSSRSSSVHKFATARFEIGLKEKSISILYIDILNFNELISVSSPHDVVSIHGHWIQEMNGIVQQRG